jgi:hypothetical protein
MARHLQAGGWRGRGIRQPGSHPMHWTSLTTWKVEGDVSLSTRTAHNQSNVTYALEGQGEGNSSAQLHVMVLPHLTCLNLFVSRNLIISWLPVRTAISNARSPVFLPISVSGGPFTRLTKCCLQVQSASFGPSLTSSSTILCLPRSIAM